MISQPRWGVFGQRYGSFAGKASVGVGHPVGVLTQPRWGVFGQRYGLFSDKRTDVVAVAVTVAAPGEAFDYESEQQLESEDEELIYLIMAIHEARHR